MVEFAIPCGLSCLTWPLLEPPVQFHSVNPLGEVYGYNSLLCWLQKSKWDCTANKFYPLFSFKKTLLLFYWAQSLQGCSSSRKSRAWELLHCQMTRILQLCDILIIYNTFSKHPFFNHQLISNPIRLSLNWNSFLIFPFPISFGLLAYVDKFKQRQERKTV